MIPSFLHPGINLRPRTWIGIITAIKEIYIITQIHHGTITAVCPEKGKTITRRAQHFKRFIRKPSANEQRDARERTQNPTDLYDIYDDDYDDPYDPYVPPVQNNLGEEQNSDSDSDHSEMDIFDSAHSHSDTDSDNSDDNDLVEDSQDRDLPVPHQEAERDFESSLGDHEAPSEIGGAAAIPSPQAPGSMKDQVPSGGNARSGQAKPTVPRLSRSRSTDRKDRVVFSPYKEIQKYHPKAPPTDVRESFNRRGRSAGPAPKIPNVLPAELERSAQLRRDIIETHQQHDQQQQK